ncbi:hypothetical protein ABE426_09930 [Sphingobacterium faecium]|uniref:hypothetical protein n=1 Tax=Sphingobacterium faecium TaxID=34087 RepID=UPI00320A7575
MKKKTILGLIAVMVTVFTINLAKADTEDAGGGSSGYNCDSSKNICYQIKKDGVVIGSKKGTIHV